MPAKLAFLRIFRNSRNKNVTLVSCSRNKKTAILCRLKIKHIFVTDKTQRPHENISNISRRR